MLKLIRETGQRFGAERGANRVVSVFSLLTLACVWALTLSFIVPRLGSLTFLRLHYSAAFGVDWIDRWQYLLIFPALGLAVFVVNGYFAGILGRRHRSLGLAMHLATLVVEVLIAAGTLIAVLLNS